MKKLLILIALMTNCHGDVQIHCTAKSLPTVTGFINHDTYLYGYHDIEIINNTETEFKAAYSYSMCPDNKNCHLVFNTIAIKPWKTWVNHYDHHLTVNYAHPSIYNVYVSTRINEIICADYGSIWIS